MSDKTKPAHYTIDFVTALPLDQCRERLERDVFRPQKNQLTPITQRVRLEGNDQFTIEREFPYALYPIQLKGCLDPHDTGGTWVHGAVTQDTENQVLIEGLIIFLIAFLLTALLFFRLRVRVFVITVPMLLLALSVMSLRWRAIRAATEDLTRWLRRRLYLTAEQVKRNGL
jgi:hypothetical protein